jgi:hypothetical protein
VWHDPRTATVERKRMVGLLIEDVTLIKAGKIAIHVRFRGGRTISLGVERPKPMALVRKTLPEVIAELDQLLENGSDREASAQLNARGYRNWKGEPFTATRVRRARLIYALKSRFDRLRERGLLTAGEIARQLGVSASQVHMLGREGVLRKTRYDCGRRCLYEPLNGATLVNGRGGRYRSRKPLLIPAASSTRETV